MAKPFNWRELLARLKELLHRIRTRHRVDVLANGRNHCMIEDDKCLFTKCAILARTSL